MFKIFGKKTASADDQMREILGDFELPNFPAITMSALQKVRDAESTDAEIADLISADPGFSTRLLGAVNSAAFALRHRVRNVHHAVSLLGRNQLESMLISVAVRDALPRNPVLGYECNRFWTTAARRASVAASLADRLDPAHRSESFTASLLQDMALPILSHQKPTEYGPVLEHWHNSNDCLATLERSTLGWDHTRFAALMCERWKFPDVLSNAIDGHHEELDENCLPAVNLVAVLREVDVEAGVEQLVELAQDRFNEPEDRTLSLIREGFETAEDIARLFS